MCCGVCDTDSGQSQSLIKSTWKGRCISRKRAALGEEQKVTLQGEVRSCLLPTNQSRNLGVWLSCAIHIVTNRLWRRYTWVTPASNQKHAFFYLRVAFFLITVCYHFHEVPEFVLFLPTKICSIFILFIFFFFLLKLRKVLKYLQVFSKTCFCSFS